MRERVGSIIVTGLRRLGFALGLVIGFAVVAAIGVLLVLFFWKATEPHRGIVMSLWNLIPADFHTEVAVGLTVAVVVYLVVAIIVGRRNGGNSAAGHGDGYPRSRTEFGVDTENFSGIDPADLG
jgi:hypothetical protein